MKDAFRPESADWVARIAAVCQELGRPAFGEAFLHAANAVVPVDHCTIFTLRHHAYSGCLLTVGKADFVNSTKEFLTGPYRDDPNFRYIQTRTPMPVVAFITAQNAGSIRRRYIDEAGVRENACCIAGREDRAAYCIFTRLASNSGYDERARKKLGQIMPILANLAVAHSCLCDPFLRCEEPGGRLTQTPGDEVERLRERLVGSPLDRLTERLRSVCFRILLGYSSEAIGLQLGITTSTINTYRKRAYAQLGITSQNELFSLYLHSLRGFTT